MAKYKALKRGYDGVQVREPGDVFEFAGKPGSWMKPVDGKAEESAAPAKPKGKKKDAEAPDEGKKPEADKGSVI